MTVSEQRETLIVPADSKWIPTLMFALLASLFVVAGAYGVLDGQIVAGLVGWVIAAMWAWGAFASWRARIYADSEWIGRTSPWPRRCARKDLSVIRIGGPFISPAWEFVRTDGTVAFRVSPLLFSVPKVTRFGEAAGVAIDAKGWDRAARSG